MRVNPQIIAAILCNLGGTNCGLLVGWLSPALPQLLSHPKPVGEVSLEQSAWLAAAFPLSGVLAPIITYLSHRYGRKICVIISAIPFAVNGVVILLATSIEALLIARFFAGIGVVGVLCNGPMYIAEIADPKVRGQLGSTFVLMYSAGIITSYSFGGFISYKAAAVVMIVVAVLNFLLFMLMPETPMFLIKNERVEEAKKSLAWLHNTNVDSFIIKSEIERLEISLEDSKISLLESAKLLFTSRPLLVGFLVCIVIFLGQAFTGMFAVHGYSVTIFTDGGGTTLRPETAAVIYAFIQFLGASSTTFAVDRLGRKFLLVCSFFGVAITMIAMGVYFDIKINGGNLDGFHWVPILALSLCVFTYMLGAGGVPFILMTDLLTSEVRTVATTLVIQFISLTGFLQLKFFEPISVHYGRHVIFYFFGVCSCVTGLFVIFIVSETKGKNNQEIIDMNYGFKKKLKIGEC